jgi:hypothetical protein
VHPPDSYQPYSPPASGYQQPGQYPAPYPTQYPPQYQYPYYGPPPQPDRTGKILVIVVVAIILVVVVTVVIAGVLVVYLQTVPSGDTNIETTLGLRAEKTSGGDWLVSVTSGSKNAADVKLQVIDPNTGRATVEEYINGMLPNRNNPDGVFYDNNQNYRLDAGDTILLRAPGGNVAAGYKVQLLVGGSIVGTIKELPG